jgi:hypothetical protein
MTEAPSCDTSHAPSGTPLPLDIRNCLYYTLIMMEDGITPSPQEREHRMMTRASAERFAARWNPAFHDLRCAVLVEGDTVCFVSPFTGIQMFYLPVNTVSRLEAHAPGFIARQPLPFIAGERRM